jgi:hypothetical protein
MKLGTQLFNPQRLASVLRAVNVNSESQSLFSEYMSSASRCFENPTNVRLLGVRDTVGILKLLRSKFGTSGDVKKLEHNILRALINLPSLSESDLIALSSIGTHYSELESFLRQSAQSVKSLRGRIHMIPYIDPSARYEYFRNLSGMSEYQFTESALSERELSTLADVVDGLVRQRVVNALKERFRSAIAKSSSLGDRSSVLNILLEVNQKDLFAEFGGAFADLEKSPKQSVRWICASEGAARNTEIKTLLWRTERDPSWLTQIDNDDAVDLVKVLNSRGQLPLIVSALTPVISNEKFEAVQQLLCVIGPGFGWVHHPRFAEAIIQKVRCKPESLELWKEFVYVFGLSDFGILRSHVSAGIASDLEEFVRTSFREATVNDLLVGRLLNRTNSGKGSMIDQSMATLEAHGIVPLHAQLGDLSPVQIIDILGHPRVGDRIENFEVICDAVSRMSKLSFSEMNEVFAKFTQHGFPCEDLVTRISDRFDPRTSVTTLREFLALCASVRLPFKSAIVTNVLDNQDLRFGPLEDVVGLAGALSSLGMLTTSLGNQLVNSALLNRAIDDVDPLLRANALGELLAACFMSLQRPNDQQLGMIRNFISGFGNEIGIVERAVIVEFTHIVGIEPLFAPEAITLEKAPEVDVESLMVKLGLSDVICRRNVRTGPTQISDVDILVEGRLGILAAGPGCFTSSKASDLTQFMKFRAFVVKHHVGDVQMQLV